MCLFWGGVVGLWGGVVGLWGGVVGLWGGCFNNKFIYIISII